MMALPFALALVLSARGIWPLGAAAPWDWLRLAAASILAYTAYHNLRLGLRQTRARALPLRVTRPGSWIPPGLWRHGALYWGTGLGLASLLVAWPLFAPAAARALCRLATLGVIASFLGLAFVRAKRDRAVGGELLGVFTLSLLMPATLLLAFGASRGAFGVLWLLVYLFNAGSIFYVRLRREMLRPDARETEIRAERKRLGLFASLQLGAIAALLVAGKLSVVAAAAFLPFWAMALPGARFGSLHPSVRSLGFALLGQSALFALWLGMGYSAPA